MRDHFKLAKKFTSEENRLELFLHPSAKGVNKFSLPLFRCVDFGKMNSLNISYCVYTNERQFVKEFIEKNENAGWINFLDFEITRWVKISIECCSTEDEGNTREYLCPEERTL